MLPLFLCSKRGWSHTHTRPMVLFFRSSPCANEFAHTPPLPASPASTARLNEFAHTCPHCFATTFHFTATRPPPSTRRSSGRVGKRVRPCEERLRRRHRRAGHAQRRLVQGRHPHHAAPPRQPHPMDLRRRRGRGAVGRRRRRDAGGGHVKTSVLSAWQARGVGVNGAGRDREDAATTKTSGRKGKDGVESATVVLE